MAKNLNIFDMLKALDARDKGYYDRLSPEAKKEFSAFLMLRWASGVQDSNSILQEWYLLETNSCVNKNFWQLTKHPKLQWLLFTQVGSTRRIRHEYIKRNMSKKDKLLEVLKKTYPSVKTEGLEVLSQLMSKEEIDSLIDETEYFEQV